MKLIKAQATNFRSIEDSNQFEIGRLTCLVGKNEAGKTGLLRAMEGIDSIGGFKYDNTQDYPRRFLAKFNERHPDGRARVIVTWWELEESDKEALADEFGSDALVEDTFPIEYGLGYADRIWGLNVNDRACLNHYIHRHQLDSGESSILQSAKSAAEAVKLLENPAQKSVRLEAILKALKGLKDTSFTGGVIDLLDKHRPRFFYTSHFDRMSGEISLNQLKADRDKKIVSKADSIFIDFLQYAGTTVEELQNSTKYEELKAKLEAASNDITEEIFQFWSQNDALEVKIDIGEGRKEDPTPFNSGTVIKIRIENRNHRASIPLSERSAGFVWFFSFLAQFKQLKKTTGRAILLLDEPGLTLHGKAQADLLRYIEDRLTPEHQVIYTTHSPFMVPAEKLETIRIVEDVVTRDARERPVVQGTKVSSDVLSVDKDTLFPLQGALGYDISQSLFIGKNVVLVEGPSDILYMQAASDALQGKGRLPLDRRWTLCPSGGIDKISPFVSLFRGNNLTVAVLCDLAAGQKGKVEKLRRDVLNAGHLFTAADFTGKQESDIEDFFHPALYAELLNQTFRLTGPKALDEDKLLAADSGTDRLVKKAEAAFRAMPIGSPEFDHYAPAAWLLRNPDFLKVDTPDAIQTLGRFEAAINALNLCINV
jgi:predicted ATP-dependent endonuclease of OLD family